MRNIEIGGFEIFQDTNQEFDNDTNDNDDDIYDPQVSSKIDGGRGQQNAVSQKQIIRSAKRLLQLIEENYVSE